MWKIVLVEVLVFCAISGIGGEDEAGGIINGPLLIVSAIIAWFFRTKFNGTLYWYSVAAFLFGLLRLLSALCPNVREILLGLGWGGAIGFLSYKFYSGHHFICIVGFICAGIIIFGGISEGLENIKYGINPDKEAKERAEERRAKLKMAKYIVKFISKL